jgi:Zn-dependent M28 family amino/carboxypeptidase
MRTLILASLAALTLSAAEAQTPPPPAVAPIPAATQATVDRLQAAALAGNGSFQIVESLTTEIGPRLAGSEAEAQARAWGVEKLKRLGFQNVRIEPFTIPYWRRVTERASVMTPGGRQTLVVAALGGSGPSPVGGIEADVVRFTSVPALIAAPADSVRGKIVFIDEPTLRTQDGSGYGAGVAKRSQCAPNAAGKGAVACIIRSVGTDTHRFAHQGGNARQPNGLAFPAAALSAPDADQITRLLTRGPVRVSLEIAVETRENAPSGNVIGEIVGRELPDEVVVIGGHLDSWDQGTGAIDDGAGVAITMAAAKLIRDLPRRPRRTIRVVLWGAEETGVHGGDAYARAHAAELPKHVIAAESDFGAREIWRFSSGVRPGALPYVRAIHNALRPLAINLGDNLANGGPDVGAMRTAGVPVFALNQNGWDYFDYHHTADDTLDKIDPAQMRQNVAAWATVVWLAADTDWDFRTPEAAPPR